MKKIRIIFMLGVVFLIVFYIVSYLKDTAEETFEEMFNSEKIITINISTEGNSIIFLNSDDENIKVKLEDGKNTLGNIKNGVLSIVAPNTKSGINVSNPKSLYIYLPKKEYKEIITNTKTGDIQIQDVDVLNLKLISEHGKISISNMSGDLQAIATMGTIETKLEIGNIEKDRINLTQKLFGRIGGKSKKTIILKTNTGKIILN